MRLPSVSTIALVVVAVVLCCPAFSLDRQYALQYEGHDLLPNVKIDGQSATIHTQGLYVDAEHWYVTGRLETEPKRALLLRLERADPNRYEYVDLTPSAPATPTRRLDHPGGFDFDGTSFWIPVARSKPQGPSVIVRVEYAPKEPLARWKWRRAFQVEDHIGALAYEPTSEYLYGANWDTEKIYVWERDGSHVETIDHTQWIKDVPDWEVAVQDWKAIRDESPEFAKLLIAGGIDKSPQRDPTKSSAVVELVSPKDRRRLARFYLPSVDGFDGRMTNEGLAIQDGRALFLLPDDLGRNARIYRYRLQPVGVIEP